MNVAIRARGLMADVIMISGMRGTAGSNAVLEKQKKKDLDKKRSKKKIRKR